MAGRSVSREVYEMLWDGTKFIKEESELLSNELKGYNGLLEIGVGTGAIALYFVRLGKHVTGVDPNKSDLRDAARKIDEPEKFDPVNASIEDWKTGSRFKAAYSTSTMCYIEDIDKAMRAVYGLLEDDGIFVVTGYERPKRWDEMNWQDGLEMIGKRKLTEDQESALEQMKRRKAEDKAGDKISKREEDSLERTVAAMENAGFGIQKKGLFYHSACYLVVGKR